jgi:hypothetical protein
MTSGKLMFIGYFRGLGVTRAEMPGIQLLRRQFVPLG